MIRLIARLDIKGPNLIKGIHLEGLRVVGDPQAFARRYYEEGIDELIYMDTVASLYGRNNLADIVRHTARDIFIPMTVGGGIQSVEHVQELLCAGADKIAVNTAALQRPELIREIAQRFGSQCMVVSIEAKRTGPDKWEALYNNGRDHSGRDVVEWAMQAVELGAGEILLTSVDQEGTRKGFDVPLVKKVASLVPVPVIASGSMGSTDHLIQVVQDGCADAVAMADVLHYKRVPFEEIHRAAIGAGLQVRT